MDPFFGFEYEQEWVPDDAGTFSEQRFAPAANMNQPPMRGLPGGCFQQRSPLGFHDSEELSITKV